VIGQRAKQINQGSRPYVDVPTGVIDGYIIAEMELRQKKIPFIIQRPLPNGSKEFWKIEDLEQVDF
jgi:DNA-directed RNA polymerase subunit K/omega